jgi:anti-anti-sigma factor
VVSTSGAPVPESFGWWVEDEDDRHVVHLFGELDIAQAERMREALVGVGRSTVELDLRRLTFLDARGLDAILTARRVILAEGSAFQIWGATGAVRRIFEVTRLTTLLEEER